MKKFILYIGLSMVFFACKSEFERVRTSNDPNLIYQKALDYYDKEDWVKAQTLFELSIPHFRGKKQAEELFYKYAMAHYLNGEYILAAHYFKRFSSTFYNSDKKEEADFLSAYSNYKQSPDPQLDQTPTEKAIESFQLFVNTYPKSKRVPECNKLMDELRKKLEIKAFQQGELYFRIGQYQAALKSFENMLIDFPDTDRAAQIRYLMVKSAFYLAKNSIFSKKEERFNDVVTFYNKFMKKHPKSKYAKEVKNIYKQALAEIKSVKA